MINITVSYERDWTWIAFPDGKPSESILEKLRSVARFSRRRVQWYITSKVEETEVKQILATDESPVLDVIDTLPATVETPKATPRKAKKSAPQATRNDGEELRQWFNTIDFETIPDDESIATTAFNYAVGIFKHAANAYGKVKYSLTTRSPQQKNAGLWSATRWGLAEDPKDLSSALDRFIAEREGKENARLALKATKAAAREAFVNPYKIGDVLYSSWGYDQTNREFYEVIKVGPVSLKVREIRQENCGATGPDSWNTAGVRGHYIGAPLWITIQVKETYHSIPSPIHGCLYLWDGKPLYASDGH